MKVIKFSIHAQIKIEVLKKHGIALTEVFIEDVVTFPDRTDTGYKGRRIAQKRINESHVLRVVCEDKGDEILVITMYPGRRNRYEKN